MDVCRPFIGSQKTVVAISRCCATATARTGSGWANYRVRFTDEAGNTLRIHTVKKPQDADR